MKVKYAIGEVPRRNFQDGFGFQSNHYGQTIRKKLIPRKHLNIQQTQTSLLFMEVCRSWAGTSPGTKNNWAQWVSFAPQPHEKNDTKFLSPYHNYVKRNFYRLLDDFQARDLMLNPALVSYVEALFAADLIATPGKLELSLTFLPADSTLLCYVYISPPSSAGVFDPFFSSRLIVTVPNANGIVDITAQYISQFGFLPVDGDTIFISMVQAGIDNGQFFFAPVRKVEVIGEITVPVKFGYLYNFFAIVDVRQITSIGSHIVTLQEWRDIETALGGTSVAGGALKETGFEFWDAPNVGATNSAQFFARGSGARRTNGKFQNLRSALRSWIDAPAPSITGTEQQIFSVSAGTFISATLKEFGQSTHIVKDFTTLPNGAVGEYVGNNGRKYTTIVIAGIEILQSALAETEFRNGEPIPNVLKGNQWKNLTQSARCAYDNDESNV